MSIQVANRESSVASSETCTVASFLRRSRVWVALAALAFAALFWPTIRGLAECWLDDPDFSHGFLIPVIGGAILFSNRARIGSIAERRSTAGLIVLLASLGFYFAGCLSFTNVIERLALWGALIGSVWYLLGPAVLAAQPFPFFFLLLAIPPPYFLLLPIRLALKGFATRLSADALVLVGYPAFPEGNVLSLGEYRLEVADACSGIRSLMAIISTAILFAYLFEAGPWKGFVLTATAIPVTVAVNVLRIIIIAVALESFQVDWTHGAEHELVGFAVFGVSLGLLYASWRFYGWFFRWKPAGEAT
jgi:exosortase